MVVGQQADPPTCQVDVSTGAIARQLLIDRRVMNLQPVRSVRTRVGRLSRCTQFARSRGSIGNTHQLPPTLVYRRSRFFTMQQSRLRHQTG